MFPTNIHMHSESVHVWHMFRPTVRHIAYMYMIVFVVVSGRNSKLGFSGRPSDFVGVLTTSMLYTLGDQTLAFFPQVTMTSLDTHSPCPHMYGFLSVSFM